MRTIKYSIILLLIAVLSSCEIDNYDEPGAIFTGRIIDVKTGEPIHTRQPDGIQIRMIQQGYSSPVPYDFWAKNDGTFRNTKLFKGTYEVTVQAGPFHNSVTKVVTLVDGVEKEEIFEVEPFVRISDISISGSGNTISGSYKLTMGDGTTKIEHSRLIVHTSPILHKNTDNLLSSPINDLNLIGASDLESMSFNDEVTNLSPGLYYARIAVESDNALGRNNYSEIIKIQL